MLSVGRVCSGKARRLLAELGAGRPVGRNDLANSATSSFAIFSRLQSPNILRATLAGHARWQEI
eukprot:7243403-Pyramimonas_sp.AAC.1